MTRTKKFALFASLAFIAATLIFVFSATDLLPRGEPIIDGRPLSDWAYFYSSSSSNNPVSRVEAAEVIVKYGQAGAPFFARMIDARDTYWSTNILRRIQRQKWFPWTFESPLKKRMVGLIALSALGTNAAPALPQLAAFPYTNRVPEQIFLNQLLGQMAALPSNRTRHSDGVSHSLPKQSYLYALPSPKARHYVVAAGWEKTVLPTASALLEFPPTFEPKLRGGGFGQTLAADLHLVLYNTTALLDWIEIWRTSGDLSDLVLSPITSQTDSTFALKLAPQAIGLQRTYNLAIFTSTTNYPLTLSDTNTTLHIAIKNNWFVIPTASP